MTDYSLFRRNRDFATTALTYIIISSVHDVEDKAYKYSEKCYAVASDQILFGLCLSEMRRNFEPLPLLEELDAEELRKLLRG